MKIAGEEDELQADRQQTESATEEIQAGTEEV